MTINLSLAKKAEHEARKAENRASMAKAIAGRIKLQIEACIHKATVETEILANLSKKADAESELLAKYYSAEALAAEKKRKAIDKKNEVSTKKSDAKAVKKIDKKDASKSAVQNANAPALKIEAAVRELELEARTAGSEAKKAKLELEEAKAAGVLKIKHAKALTQAQSDLKLKKAEFEIRMAESKAWITQAEAKKAEAKAIKTGNTTEAQAFKLEAKIHRAEAITKQDEVRKMKAAPTTKASPKSPPPVDPLPKGQARCIEKKHLSAKGLLEIVHEVFQNIPDQNQDQDPTIQKSKPKITLCDCLMSGLAVFSLKYPSLLQFDNDSQEGGPISHNLKSLYKVNQVPCDTYMRECLDKVDPVYLRPAFKKLFARFQRGKGLEKYVFLDGYYLASGDGTGLFSSKTIGCQDCCTKHHKDGSITYYHQMMSAVIVHPEHATVIPLCPEPITNQDGSDKNDCERNASERLYRHIRREHPHLPLIITEDALGSNGPHIRLLQELEMGFILVATPDGNKSLFEYLKGIQLQAHTHTDGDLNYKFQYINDIPLNDSHNDLMVNFFEVWVHDKNGELKYHNSWITNITITSNNVYRLCQGGRAKWKIENETFNTLKTQGYNFEHNYGHGFKHLSTILALLMFLAFFIDQIQQSSCGLFQAAWAEMKSKVRLWGRMKAYFTTLFIESWEKLWQAIALGLKGRELVSFLDTS